ncbi:MAG TPA: hypothetical protein PK075_07940 [Chitinophagales bacterium]|nr:hypothetical protein [Chitinophagales bacterium]
METLKPKYNKQDIINVGLILLLGFLIARQLQDYMDVLLWDEAIYLDRGFLLWKIIPNTWGPVYSVWYKLLSYIEQNKIALYYLNFKILFLLSSILAYLFMVALRMPKVMALFFTCMWLIHPYNLPSWPKISHFVICIILFAAIFIQYLKSTINQIVVFSIAFLICGFARPELYLSFIFSVLLLFILIFIYRKNINPSNILSICVWLLFVGITYKLYRTPLTSGDAQRGLGVFIQHFALNYSIWNKQDILWWFDFQDAVMRCFKPPYTLKNFVQNPYLWQHFSFNIQLLLSKSFSLISNLIFPFHFISKKIFFVLSSLLSLYLLYKNKCQIKYFFQLIKEQFLLFGFLLISVLPSIASSIYAHPRTHYLVILFPFIFFIFSAFFPKHKTSNVFHSLLIFVVFIFFMPKAKDFQFFDLYGTDKNMMTKKTINFIEDKYQDKPTTILDIDGLMPSLMNSNFKSSNIRPLIKEDSVLISSIVLKEQPDIIYVTPTMMKLKKNKTDSLFQQMIAEPERFNYYKQAIPTLGDVYLLEKTK